MHQVVDNYDVVQISVLDDSEILDVESIVGLHAVFPMENAVDGFVLFVQVADDGLGVVDCGGGKDINEEVFTHSIQEFEAVGSDVESEIVAIKFQIHVRFFVIED